MPDLGNGQASRIAAKNAALCRMSGFISVMQA